MHLNPISILLVVLSFCSVILLVGGCYLYSLQLRARRLIKGLLHICELQSKRIDIVGQRIDLMGGIEREEGEGKEKEEKGMDHYMNDGDLVKGLQEDTIKTKMMKNNIS